MDFEFSGDGDALSGLMASGTPWYIGGLRFECTGCGGCCGGAPGYVWVDDAEIATLAAAVGMSSADFEKQYVRRVGSRGRSLKERPDGDCVLLSAADRRCMAYAVRPRQCRTWPFWDSNLATRAHWDLAAAGCPGCNCGERVPFDKIEQRRKEIEV